jgi:hypothetical protein
MLSLKRNMSYMIPRHGQAAEFYKESATTPYCERTSSPSSAPKQDMAHARYKKSKYNKSAHADHKRTARHAYTFALLNVLCVSAPPAPVRVRVGPPAIETPLAGSTPRAAACKLALSTVWWRFPDRLRGIVLCARGGGGAAAAVTAVAVGGSDTVCAICPICPSVVEA